MTDENQVLNEKAVPPPEEFRKQARIKSMLEYERLDRWALDAPEGYWSGQAKLLANMVPTGRSPMLPAETLARLGFSIAIYPSAGMGAACAALEAAYGWLHAKGSLEGSPVPAFDMARLHELVGFADVWEFERRHVEK